MAEEAVLVSGKDSEGRNALAPQATGWPTGQSILLRFALLFFILQFFPFPFNVVSGTDWLTHAYSRLWATVAPWVARHVFRLTETFPTYPGSSDTIFDYLRLFCVIALAVVTTLVWSLADRRRRDYARLHEWLRAYVRYFLATTLLAYGIVKMFGGQFGPPLIALLMQPYGKTTPLDLLWTFMGISTAYKFFTGAAETVGALLLCSRRTTTLGALVLLAVLSNVVMLNLAYDAPVKLFSSQLLLMTCFLLVPEAARLVDFFVLHRPTTPVEIRPYFASAVAHRSALAAKALLIGLAMYSAVVAGWGQVKRFGPSAPEHPLHGFYEVEEFAADGSTLPPLFTDSRRWRTMIVEKRGTVIVRAMDDSRKYFQSTADTTKGELTLSLLPDRTQTVSLAWSRPDPAHLLVQGEFFGESATVHLKRTDESTFPLVRKGFHWINDIQ